MRDLTGEKLGQYTLEARVGQGGMASVYKAYQERMRRYVAIKVLPDMLAVDPTFYARFEREAQTIAQLEHPSILPVYDFGQDGHTTYIVMRYVDTGSLADRMGQGQLSYDEIRHIIRQLAEGLDYAHRQGIVHRDLKPDNVFLDKEGNALLGDFGIAQVTEGTQQLTGEAIIGTPAYMSPEQGQGEKLDGRSDIYALGVILYELFTGQQPYQAETPMGLVIKHITTAMPDPRTIAPELHEAIANVILKATAKTRENRYQSMVDLANDLEQAIGIAQTGGTSAPSTVILDPVATPTTTPAPIPTPMTAQPAPTSTTAPTPSMPSPAQPVKTPAPTTGKKGLPVIPLAIGGFAIFCLASLIIAYLLFGGDDDGEVTTIPTPTSSAVIVNNTPETNNNNNNNTDNNNTPPPPATLANNNGNNNSNNELTVDPNITGTRLTASYLLEANQESVFGFGSIAGTTVNAIVDTDLDVAIEIRSINGTVIGTEDSTFGREELTVTLPNTVDDYILAIRNLESEDGTYTVDIQSEDVVVFSLTNGDVGQGLVTANDSVAYAFFATAGTTTDITVQPGANFDNVVEIYLMDQTLIENVVNANALVSQDSSFGGDPETVSFTAEVDGFYLINVKGFEGASGPFTVTINQ
ncbi:MAG TPA: serine/threonine-protein kinase [Anaerolineae bacterium]|nr:serine/threonine-protein kinase [Anaerolineae bacterium]